MGEFGGLVCGTLSVAAKTAKDAQKHKLQVQLLSCTSSRPKQQPKARPWGEKRPEVGTQCGKMGALSQLVSWWFGAQKGKLWAGNGKLGAPSLLFSFRPVRTVSTWDLGLF